MSTEIQETINRLRELDQTASPAPWSYLILPVDLHTGIQDSVLVDGTGHEFATNAEDAFTRNDFDVILEARNAIPALIAEIERLTAENQALKRENQLAWSKGHAAGWDCHIVTMQAADLLPKDQKTSSPYQENK